MRACVVRQTCGIDGSAAKAGLPLFRVSRWDRPVCWNRQSSACRLHSRLPPTSIGPARALVRYSSQQAGAALGAPLAASMGPPHPLDPLSAAEVSAVAAACRALAKAQGWGSLRFNVISLQEPPKAALLAFEAGSGPPPARRGFAILQTPPEHVVYEVLAELGSDGSAASISSVNKVEGVQPLASPDDCIDAEEICKADEQVVAALAARGISDLSLVMGDPWSVHDAPCEGRLIQLFMYAKSSPDDNHYAHPLDLLPLVDLHQRRVVRIDQHTAPLPVPAADNNYHSQLFPGPWRSDIKPLDVLQPEGPSFSVDGNLVSWQKWQFRVGFNYREGLVLHQLSYDGRPVMFRGSLVEMAVPYGDPRDPYQRKCAFDVGDYGLGYCSMPLTLGCDCLGHIKYFDAVLCNSKGDPVTISNAVCMHEEDAGLLWKHVDYRSGHNESRRSRRLVLQFVATVVNYEYKLAWMLHQDGTINYEIGLTGELSTNCLSEGEGERPGHGTLVGAGVNAQHHQHMFCARLDMAVDDPTGGKGLIVSEVDVEPMGRCPANPHGNGFIAKETDLLTMSAAQRMTAPEKARIWKVKNPAVMNPVSQAPVAFKVMLNGSPRLMAEPDSAIAKRAVFASRNLWVTPYSEQQRFPAGDYVLQSKECRGLSEWTKQDASLADADPVLWLSFGVTHVVRVEDFPVMPVETTGFMLKPFGFFSGNPGLDIPPTKNAASRLHGTEHNGTAAAANGSSGCCGSGGPPH